MLDVNPAAVTVTVAPPVAVTLPKSIFKIFPVTSTGADPDASSSPRETVVPLPVSVIFASPVMVEDPKEEVTTCGDASMVIGNVPALDTKPCSVTTMVVLLSPVIEKVPILEVADTPVTKIEVSGVVAADVNSTPVIVGATSPWKPKSPGEEVADTPVKAYSVSRMFQRLSLQPIS